MRPFLASEADLDGSATAVDELVELLRQHVDPEDVERHGRLPEPFLDLLKAGGFFRLTMSPSLGGRGLSPLGACRVVEMAASHCSAAAFALSVANGFGSGTYLEAIADGPLRDMIATRVAAGIVSAGADAEAIGTANQRRATRAVPVEDGRAFHLTGEKVFIGNGPIADLMDVSATVTGDDGTEQVKLFFVDSRTPGFSVTAWHEFMGLRGAAIGALRLDQVRIPAEHLLDESSDGWRMRPATDATVPDASSPDVSPLARLANVGRMMVIAPPALAITKLCLFWSREFLRRRSIDGRSLGDYEEIKRMVAATAADVYLIEAVQTWTLHRENRADTVADLTPAKNLVSLACWRSVDRTMSLMGGEGYETARSKAARGVPALPVERAFRDARALRVAGGVDFMLDHWSATENLATIRSHTGEGGGVAWSNPTDPALSGDCGEHLAFVAAQARRLSTTCTEVLEGARYEELIQRQRLVRLIGQTATELLGMSIVLAKAAQQAEEDDFSGLSLADVSCTAARLRIASQWQELDVLRQGGDGTDSYRTVSEDWLANGRFEYLVNGILAVRETGAPT